MKGLVSITGAMALACAGSVVEASLIDRGNGFIYDDVLDITWLQDARLAASSTFGVSGIQSDGSMAWETGFEWIAAMNATNYLGFDNWRMPTLTPVNGVSFQYTVSYDGSTDRGFNNLSPTNELSHLFYASLGNIGLCSVNNATGSSPDNCETNPYDTWGLQNTGPFENFIAGRYWTDVHHTHPDEERAFDLDATFGQMGTGGTAASHFVWAVIDGDVGSLVAVPVPAAGWLLGSGIIGLLALRRKAA